MPKFLPLLLVILSLVLVPSVYAAANNDTMVGYWKLDQTTQGASVTDSSGDGYNGTPLGGGGGPTPTTDKPTTIFPDTRALDFDGNDYIEVADTSVLDSSVFTIAFWVKFDTVNSNHRTLVAKWDVGTRQQYTIQLTNSNVIGFWTGNGAGVTSGALTSALTPTTGTWYHITAVANGTNRALYINGTANKYTGTGTAVGNSNVELTIGSKKNGSGTYFEFLDGKMDDIRFYNRVLSDTEIDDLADGNHTTSSWTGNNNGVWEEATNWNPTVIPDPYTKVVINPSSVEPNLTEDEAVARLTITNNALLELDTFDFTINDSGTVSNEGYLRLKGDQTITGFTNDTDSGTVFYDGPGTYNSLALGNSYYNLGFDDTGTYNLNAPVSINGNFELSLGTLNANGNNISVTENWTKSGGTFTPAGNTVILNGADQAMTGSTTFYNLTKTVSSTAILRFQAAQTQTITNALTLQGAAGNLLSLRSSSGGVQFNINPQGTRNISYVDVKDSNNTNSTAIAFSSTNTYGTNLTNWLLTGSSTPSSNNSPSILAAPNTTDTPQCGDSTPTKAPDLFQITANRGTATVHFVPSSDGHDEYYVSYGLDEKAESYGVSFNNSNLDHSINYQINALFPGTWYFKVRGAHGCMPGPWSKVMSVKVGYGASTVATKNVLGVTTAATPSDQCTDYTVQSGDSLWMIASNQLGSGPKYTNIMTQNNLSSDKLSIGQSLKLCN